LFLLFTNFSFIDNVMHLCPWRHCNYRLTVNSVMMMTMMILMMMSSSVSLSVCPSVRLPLKMVRFTSS